MWGGCGGGGGGGLSFRALKGSPNEKKIFDEKVKRQSMILREGVSEEFPKGKETVRGSSEGGKL